jgi:hypothetical protein
MARVSGFFQTASPVRLHDPENVPARLSFAQTNYPKNANSNEPRRHRGTEKPATCAGIWSINSLSLAVTSILKRISLTLGASVPLWFNPTHLLRIMATNRRSQGSVSNRQLRRRRTDQAIETRSHRDVAVVNLHQRSLRRSNHVPQFVPITTG